MRQWTREQIETANKIFHKYEAELYDERHPEIFLKETERWSNFFISWNSRRLGPSVIVDIGAGTGFVYSIAERSLKEGDRFIATDLSPEMLEVCRRRISRPGFLEVKVVPAENLQLPDGSVDLATVNSVLHHLPDPPAFLKEVARVLKPGGLLVVMHEPNIDFARSKTLRNIAWLAHRFSLLIDRPQNSVKKNDYSHIYKAVNNELTARGLITAPLDQKEIQSMVDIHSPTAGGAYDELGFNLDYFRKNGLSDWKTIEFTTYNFLGKLDPTLKAWQRCLNSMLSRIAPCRGASFTLVIQKPYAENSDAQ